MSWWGSGGWPAVSPYIRYFTADNLVQGLMGAQHCQELKQVEIGCLGGTAIGRSCDACQADMVAFHKT
jgi:hypothetical protein